MSNEFTPEQIAAFEAAADEQLAKEIPELSLEAPTKPEEPAKPSQVVGPEDITEELTALQLFDRDVAAFEQEAAESPEEQFEEAQFDAEVEADELTAERREELELAALQKDAEAYRLLPSRLKVGEARAENKERFKRMGWLRQKQVLRKIREEGDDDTRKSSDMQAGLAQAIPYLGDRAAAAFNSALDPNLTYEQAREQINLRQEVAAEDGILTAYGAGRVLGEGVATGVGAVKALQAAKFASRAYKANKAVKNLRMAKVATIRGGKKIGLNPTKVKTAFEALGAGAAADSVYGAVSEFSDRDITDLSQLDAGLFGAAAKRGAVEAGIGAATGLMAGATFVGLKKGFNQAADWWGNVESKRQAKAVIAMAVNEKKASLDTLVAKSQGTENPDYYQLGGEVKEILEESLQKRLKTAQSRLKEIQTKGPKTGRDMGSLGNTIKEAEKNIEYIKKTLKSGGNVRDYYNYFKLSGTGSKNSSSIAKKLLMEKKDDLVSAIFSGKKGVKPSKTGVKEATEEVVESADTYKIPPDLNVNGLFKSRIGNVFSRIQKSFNFDDVHGPTMPPAQAREGLEEVTNSFDSAIRQAKPDQAGEQLGPSFSTVRTAAEEAKKTAEEVFSENSGVLNTVRDEIDSMTDDFLKNAAVAKHGPEKGLELYNSYRKTLHQIQVASTIGDVVNTQTISPARVFMGNIRNAVLVASAANMTGAGKGTSAAIGAGYLLTSYLVDALHGVTKMGAWTTNLPGPNSFLVHATNSAEYLNATSMGRYAPVLAKRMMAGLTADNEDAQKWEEGVRTVFSAGNSAYNLSQAPVKRTMESIEANREDLFRALMGIDSDLGMRFLKAVEDRDLKTVDEIFSLPEMEEFIEEGQGIDGRLLKDSEKEAWLKEFSETPETQLLPTSMRNRALEEFAATGMPPDMEQMMQLARKPRALLSKEQAEEKIRKDSLDLANLDESLIEMAKKRSGGYS